jgi:arsenate reductase
MAEAILNHRGSGHATAYSAGSNPLGTVRPAALAQLETAHIPILGLRSKSWDEFASSNAPKLDFVFTVCDHAAKEVCPISPGQPMTAHWGIPDPAVVQGPSSKSEKPTAGCLFLSRPQDQLVHQSASQQPRPPRHQERNRPNWESMSYSRLSTLSFRN